MNAALIEIDLMNHVRLLEDTIELAPFIHEKTLIFPLDDRGQLEFIWLQLEGVAAPREGMPRGLFPNDVRAYINEVEVTESVIAELRKKIAGKDPITVRGQYKAGLDAWIRLAHAYGAAYPGDLANDEAMASQLSSNPNPASLLLKLGDNHVGSGGCLHIFNYLYQYIDLDPLSLWDLITAHNASGATHIDFRALTVPKLTISSGPCRLFDAAFDPGVFKGQGGVNLRLTFSYHNPLDDDVKELERKLDRLQKKILARLNTIADACEDGGPFQLAIANLKGNVAGLEQQVASMRADVQSNAAQVAALRAQAQALQDAVNQL